MARATFHWDSTALDTRLALLPEKLQERFAVTVDAAAPKAETIMKERAPWGQAGTRDRWGRVRTGEARDNLYAIASHDYAAALSRHTIELGNRLPRARFLEIAMNGRFQIIVPTRNAVGRSLMLAFQGLLEEIDASPAIEIAEPVITESATSQGPERISERDVGTPLGSVRRAVGEIFRRAPNIVRRLGWRRR